MKKHYKTTMILVSSLIAMNSFAQIVTADFENLTLAPNSYNDGASGAGAFMSGAANFQNSYNSSWMYWESGFAYSNQGDTTVSTSDYMTQLYQTKAGAAHAGSANFGIGQQGAKITFPSYAVGANTHSIYITNTTFAYNSMFLGDGIGKKFGDTLSSPHSAAGVHGSFPDWFRLDITGYSDGLLMPDTIHFYLADYRFTDDSQDYIIKDWTFVDLSNLGGADSLQFTMASSDVGGFGINTPTFFCIDDLQTSDIVTGIHTAEQAIAVNAYPNPFEDALNLTFANANTRMISVYNSLGALVYSVQTKDASVELNSQAFNSGIYFVKVTEGDHSSTLRLIKK